MKEEIVEIKGKIARILPNTRFIVKLDNGHEIEAYIWGKLRKRYFKLIKGDTVLVKISSYNLDKGRIIKRF